MTTFIGHICFVYILSRNFKISVKDFLVLFFFAGILPDLDILFGVHRTITHSLFLIAVVFGLWYLVKNKYILIAGYGILSHVFLDIFDTVPVQLFWPLDYKISLGLWKASNITANITALSPADYVLLVTAISLFLTSLYKIRNKLTFYSLQNLIYH